jgi:hypothetical protein
MINIMPAPRVQKIEFRNIVVNDVSYGESDVLLFWDDVEPVEKSHAPRPELFDRILLRKPQVLIVGTGFSGCVRLSGPVLERLHRANIEWHALPTPDAIAKWRAALKAGKRAVALIHTTC